MPEAFACLLVCAVCVGVFAFAWLQSLSPKGRDIQAETETLEREILWLEERLTIADHENWHGDMRDSIEEKLAETRRRHEALKALA